MSDKITELELDSLVRVQFYSYNINITDKESNQTDITWFNATRCKEFYADSPYQNVQEEFNEVEDNFVWYCPDFPNITVNNDPLLYEYGLGRAFVMVVNL